MTRTADEVPLPNPLHFDPTRWTLVYKSVDNNPSIRNEALSQLYDRYRPPLTRYIERRWPSFRSEASDLLHDFMLRLIVRNDLRQVSNQKGKFRSFLLTLLSRFLQDECKRRQAERRRPDFDHDVLETNIGSVSQIPSSSEDFDFEWALHMVSLAREQLENLYREKGKLKTLRILRQFLTNEAIAADLERAAATLEISSSAVRSELHRLRDSHRNCLRQTVSQTLGPDDDVHEEIRYLFQVLVAKLRTRDSECSLGLPLLAE